MKKLLTAATASVLGLCFMVSQAPIASANATSAQGYYCTNGKCYRNIAGAYVIYAGQAHAGTMVGPQSGHSIPSGWMSARGRMFTQSGALYCEGGNVYNNSTVNYYSLITGNSCTRYGRGFNFYSYGVTRAWRGSDYGNYYTFKSPMQTS